MNTLYLGDNLPILQTIPDNSVDLIYIDPPFNSNRNYSGMIKEKINKSSSNATILAQFEDTWRGGMKTYIHEFMFPIVKELHRILKPTGSFYLHCDPTAQAYLQVEVLDPIFGIRNLMAEIVWKYSWGVRTDKRWNWKHDIIFVYSKSDKWTFNFQDVMEKREEEVLRRLETGNKSATMAADKGKSVDKTLALPTDVWNINQINAMAKERTGYPTQKPEKLLERIILASSNEGDVVLDCFMGSGTTLVVADRLKRNFIGIDQSAVALAVAKSRLALNQDLFTSSSFSVVTKKWDYDKLRKMDDFEFEKLMVAKLGGTPSKASKGGDMGIDGIANSRIVISVKRSEGIGRNVVDNLMTATRRHLRDEKSTMNAKESFVVKIQKGDVDLADYDAILVAFSFGKGTFSEVVDMKVKDNFKILLLTVEDILPVARPPKVEIMVVDGQSEVKETPNFLSKLTPSKGVIGEYLAQNSPQKELQYDAHLGTVPKERGSSSSDMTSKPTGYYTFTAQTQTTSKIENYSWLIKDKKTGENVESESLTTENNLNKNLKKGEYLVSCEVVDEDGLGGNGEVEVVVVG
jgi:DNA modification methylase